MMVYKEGKLVAVINEKSMASISRDEDFNRTYQGMIDHGMTQLAPLETSDPNVTGVRFVNKRVSPGTVGVLAGELESLGYRVKM